jgi:hypothetical protein
VIAAVAPGGTGVPEQSGRTHLAELFERAACPVQQAILVAISGQLLQLAVDGVQVPHEAIQPLASLLELRSERLVVVRFHCVHR